MKQKNSKNEYFEVWDAGTYQTGNTTPPKKSSPLVTVLLMLVIFLGGIASAMGIINLRLLAALQQQQPTETVPIKLQIGSNNPNYGNDSRLETVPSIPEIDFSMDLADQLPEEDVDSSTDVQTVTAPCVVTVAAGEANQGSGLVLTEDGYILTFAHLIDNAERVFVTLPDGTLHRAAIVGKDVFSDLAVLYIRSTGLTPATFCSEETPAPGNKVTALCGESFSGGTVFAAEKNLLISGQKMPLLKTSAATGENAGVLFNHFGQVIGIISPRIGTFLRCSDEGLAYVIPSTTVKTVVDQLLRQGFVSGRPCIGACVEEVTNLYQNYWKLPDGLRITGVTDSALREGDILIRLDGKRITTTAELYEILFSCPIGQEVEAVVFRDGKEITLTLHLNEAIS